MYSCVFLYQDYVSYQNYCKNESHSVWPPGASSTMCVHATSRMGLWWSHIPLVKPCATTTLPGWDPFETSRVQETLQNPSQDVPHQNYCKNESDSVWPKGTSSTMCVNATYRMGWWWSHISMAKPVASTTLHGCDHFETRRVQKTPQNTSQEEFGSSRLWY